MALKQSGLVPNFPNDVHAHFIAYFVTAPRSMDIGHHKFHFKTNNICARDHLSDLFAFNVLTMFHYWNFLTIFCAFVCNDHMVVIQQWKLYIDCLSITICFANKVVLMRQVMQSMLSKALGIEIGVTAESYITIKTIPVCGLF